MIPQRRYPENPEAKIGREDVTISYNGIRLYLSRADGKYKKGVALSKLEESARGGIEEKFLFLNHKERSRLDQLNPSDGRERASLLNLVKRHADWFTPKEIRTLDEELTRYLTPKKALPKRTARTASEGRMPYANFHERRRKVFRDSVALMLSRNLPSIGDAAVKLGYRREDVE